MTAQRLLRLAERAVKAGREAYQFNASAYTHEAFAQSIDVRNLARELRPRGVAVELMKAQLDAPAEHL